MLIIPFFHYFHAFWTPFWLIQLEMHGFISYVYCRSFSYFLSQQVLAHNRYRFLNFCYLLVVCLLFTFLSWYNRHYKLVQQILLAWNVILDVCCRWLYSRRFKAISANSSHMNAWIYVCCNCGKPISKDIHRFNP